MRSKFRALVSIPILALAATLPGPAPADEPPPAGPGPPSEPAAATPRARDLRNETPATLFASAEEAWRAGDAERLAALVDTTAVRISLKPGSPPTAAVTRNSASFLFQDQLRLVRTRSFQVVRFGVDKKGAAATARWSGDWGGRLGERDVEVAMTAVQRDGRWLLTEVRAKD